MVQSVALNVISSLPTNPTKMVASGKENLAGTQFCNNPIRDISKLKLGSEAKQIHFETIVSTID